MPFFISVLGPQILTRQYQYNLLYIHKWRPHLTSFVIVYEKCPQNIMSHLQESKLLLALVSAGYRMGLIN